jgi:glutathione S-transferase
MSLDIRIERLIDTTPERAFDEWNDPSARERWYAAEDGWITRAETDLRVGGEWYVDFGADAQSMYREHGVYTVVDRPERVVYTMVFTYPDGRTFETLTTVTFEERDGKTLLTLLDAGYPDVGTRDGHASGWPGFIDRFERGVSARD